MTFDSVEIVDESKTQDKDEIEAEEKEQMLKKKEDETIESSETKQSEEILKPSKVKSEREAKPKFIPIGGIKMPGFITRAIEREPKDQTKDEEAAQTEEQIEENNRRKRRMLFSCPFTSFLHKHEDSNKSANSDGQDEPNSTTKGYNLQAIKLPLTNLFHKNAKREATLASVETLEDKVDAANDGMETIKLDDKDEKEPEDNIQPRLPWRERLRLKQFIIDDLIVAIAVFLVVIAIVIGVIVSLALACPPSERPLRDNKYMSASTSCGEVEGILEEGAFKFFGIPYAVPPIGARRFTTAQSLNSLDYCWNGTLKAHEPVAPCTQILENGTIVGKEDCLTLDIVTPKVRCDNLVAVVVFIDANTLAGGIGPTHLSSKYAHLKDVVFVKPNFRLGPLGFIALEILSQENYPKTSGNYGISDLLAALEWVQLNIKNFGGDPTKVTIYGHRAGATLASVITSMKHARNLYRAAWLVSGSVIFNGSSLEDVEKSNQVYLKKTGCDNTDCLRNLTPEKIVRSTPDVWLSRHNLELPKTGETQHSWIVIDGELVRTDPIKGWEEERKIKEAKSIVFVTTEHAAHSNVVFKRHLNWSENDVEAEFNTSALIEARELLYQFGRNYSGLAAMTTSVRLTCPLLYVARIRLDLPIIVIRGVDGLSDVNADIGAILGTVDTPTPIHRRHVSAVQAMFYNLVWDGNLTAPSQIITIEQDPLPVQSLPGCDVMFQKDLAPRYALVD